MNRLRGAVASQDVLSPYPQLVRAGVRRYATYRQAAIQNPREIRLFEVDDTYAYKELQHLIALGLYSEGAEAGRSLEAGETKLDGSISGGSDSRCGWCEP